MINIWNTCALNLCVPHIDHRIALMKKTYHLRQLHDRENYIRQQSTNGPSLLN